MRQEPDHRAADTNSQNEVKNLRHLVTKLPCKADRKCANEYERKMRNVHGFLREARLGIESMIRRRLDVESLKRNGSHRNRCL
jgi:hypothetical protein